MFLPFTHGRSVVGSIAAGLLAATALAACADGSTSPQDVTVGETSSAAAGAVTCTKPPQAQAKNQALTLPDKAASQGKTYLATVQTNCGAIVLELDGSKAPQTVASFIQLSTSYYDNSPCHRLVADFVLQCGDPTGTGSGGPGYTFGLENAPKDNQYPRGVLAMARQANDGNSNGGQFFITLANTPIPADTAGGYTIFGKVVSGMNVVDYVAAKGVAAGSESPTQPISILKITVQEKKA
ncbi:peptidylprolyl isomerase [Calidifontibacter terrae]